MALLIPVNCLFDPGFRRRPSLRCSSAQPSSKGKFSRVVVSHAPKYQRFVVKAKTFSHQYSHIYTKRMLALRPLLRAAAQRKWADFCEL